MSKLFKSRIRLVLNIQFLLACLCGTTNTMSQQKVIQLYNGSAKGSENWNWNEKLFFVKTPLNANVAYNITKPTLTVFTPDSANGTAIIICPGGAFRVLNIETEGSFVAKELIKKGFTVFLLKYRLVHTLTDDPWQEAVNSLKDTSQLKRDNNAMVSKLANEDALTAISYVRTHAAEFKINPRRIGIVGFSAGGALVLNLSINDELEARPNFSAFIYSTYRQNNIPSNAPPAFIACATDDILAASTNSTNLYNAWIAAKNSAELHIYAKGGHGLRNFPANSWLQRYIEWINKLDLAQQSQ